MADIFKASGDNDTVISHGGADEFHGNAGNDHIIVDLIFNLIEGGTGSDVLCLDGSNLNLDLPVLGDKISGIETISFMEEMIIL